VRKNNELIEAVADLCHEQWAGWMRYLFTKGTWEDDGKFVINEDSAKRWWNQMETSYSKLSPKEQESDRTETDKFIKLFDKFNEKEGEN